MKNSRESQKRIYNCDRNREVGKKAKPASQKKKARGRQDLRINVFNNKASSKNISIKLAVIRSLFRLYFRGEKVNLFQSGRHTVREVVPLCI